MRDGIYPRPIMARKSYFDLDGQWDFKEVFVEEEIPTIKYRETIEVPYVPQSRFSGINRPIHESHFVVYRKEFSLADEFISDKDMLVLNFGAIDQMSRIYFNDRLVKCNNSGYHHISVEIPYERVKKTNVIEVVCRDILSDAKYPYGKQMTKPIGSGHTPCTGIWQNVWLESVPKIHITNLKIDVTLNSADITVFTNAKNSKDIKNSFLYFQGENYKFKLYRKGETIVLKTKLEIENPKLWSPEDPNLYYFQVKLDRDIIQSYFGLRTISIEKVDGIPRILLNNQPYFFNGVIDQGYFEGGLYTPRSLDDYEDDIWIMKNMGFNTIRKNAKVEPDYFYYLCDKLGMIVFQDMVNNGKNSVAKESLLQTIGFAKSVNDVEMHYSIERRGIFINNMKATVEQLYNYPSVCYYTIFNEGKGQFEGSKLYSLLKKLDPSRIVDTASGWFKGSDSDVESEHIYYKPFKIKNPSDKPIILSRFGGYYHKSQGFKDDDKFVFRIGWYRTRKSLNEKIKKVYSQEIIPSIDKGLCGCMYANFSDIEDEYNGLVTSDRELCKINSSIKIKATGSYSITINKEEVADE